MAGLASTTNAPAAVLNPLSSDLTYIFYPGFIQVLDAALERGMWTRFPMRRATGADIRPKFRYGRNTGGGPTTETGTVGTAGSQKTVSGRHPFYIYTKPVEVTDFIQAQSIAAGHSGYEAWSTEIGGAAEDMRQDLEKALHAAQTGNHMHGIPDYIDDGSNAASIWGISRLVHPFLRSIHLQASGTNRDLSFTLLRQVFRTALHGTGADIVGSSSTHYKEDQGGAQINLLSTTPGIEQNFEALLTANNRFMPADPSGQVTGVDPSLADLVYRRAPMVASKYALDNVVFGLDMRYWHIEVLPQYLVTSAGERMETDFALVIEGRIGQKIKAFWRIYCELVCTNPHRNFRLGDITQSAEPS